MTSRKKKQKKTRPPVTCVSLGHEVTHFAMISKKLQRTIKGGCRFNLAAYPSNPSVNPERGWGRKAVERHLCIDGLLVWRNKSSLVALIWTPSGWNAPRQSDWHLGTRPVPLLKPRPPLTQHTQSGPRGMQTDTHMVPIGQFGCLWVAFDSLVDHIRIWA